VPQTSLDEQNDDVRRVPMLPIVAFLLVVGVAIVVSAFIGVPPIAIASHAGAAVLAIGVAALLTVVAKFRQLAPKALGVPAPPSAVRWTNGSTSRAPHRTSRYGNTMLLHAN